MGKTSKDRKDVPVSSKKEKPSQPKEKKVKTKGPRQDNYEPRVHLPTSVDLLCYDYTRLLNGEMDREHYSVGGAEFIKVQVPKYKGAEDGDVVLAIELASCSSGHKLELMGIKPGTNVLWRTLNNVAFISKIKGEQRRIVYELYKFLRVATEQIAGDIDGPATLTYSAPTPQLEPQQIQTEEVVAEEVEKEPNVAASVLYDGTRTGLVEMHGITFRVASRKNGEHEYNVITVHNAPFETPLYDLSGCETHITVGLLHRNEFSSRLTCEGEVTRQKRIWTFLRQAFKEEGIIVNHSKVEASKVIERTQSTTRPKMLALANMLGLKAGYYDLSGNGSKLIAKLYKQGGKSILQVSEMDNKEHPLAKVGVFINFFVPVSVFMDGSEHDGATGEFIAYVLGVLTMNGIKIKATKKGAEASSVVSSQAKQQAMNTQQEEIIAPQFRAGGNKKTKVFMVREFGSDLLTQVSGTWMMPNGVTLVSEPNQEDIVCVKAVQCPCEHEFTEFVTNGIFAKVHQLHFHEGDYVPVGRKATLARDFREALRKALREIGALPEPTVQQETVEETQQAIATA